ncbi:MAG: hypothetical protein ABL996_01080 [Micropepsaceae bacterium]
MSIIIVAFGSGGAVRCEAAGGVTGSAAVAGSMLAAVKHSAAITLWATLILGMSFSETCSLCSQTGQQCGKTKRATLIKNGRGGKKTAFQKMLDRHIVHSL